jgi:hypothetical protein
MDAMLYCFGGAGGEMTKQALLCGAMLPMSPKLQSHSCRSYPSHEFPCYQGRSMKGYHTVEQEVITYQSFYYMVKDRDQTTSISRVCVAQNVPRLQVCCANMVFLIFITGGWVLQFNIMPSQPPNYRT